MKISEKAWKDLLGKIQSLDDHVKNPNGDLKIERMATDLRKEIQRILEPIFAKINRNAERVSGLNGKVNLIIALLIACMGAVAYKILF